MKYNEIKNETLLSESYYNNVQALTKISEYLIDKSLEYGIDEKEEIISLEREVGSKSQVEKLEKSVEQYGDIYVKLVYLMTNSIPVFFFNNKNKFSFNGRFSYNIGVRSEYNNGSILIALGNILDTNGKEVSISSVKENKRKIISTLNHELKHVLQMLQQPHKHRLKNFELYNDENGGQSDMNKYRKDPNEMDAAFIHHLYDEESLNPQEFVKNVMDKFSTYKDLTPKQYKHYKRKAAAYIAVMLSDDENDYKFKGIESLKEVLKRKYNTEVDALMSLFDKFEGNDLRKINGYDKDSRNFYFPFDRARPMMYKLFKPENKDIKIQTTMIGVLALLNMMNDGSVNFAYLNKKRDFNLDEVIPDIDNKVQEFNGFDTEFFKKIILNLKETIDVSK